MNATLVGLVLISAASAAQQNGDWPLVFERGAPTEYARMGEILELRSGPGWLRSPRLFSDFTLTFDYRPTSSDTEAALFIRTLIGAPSSASRWGESVYEIPLPSETSAAISPALRALKGTVSVTSDGRVALRPMEEWQHVEVTASGGQVSITLNGLPVGEFAVAHFTGHILFDTTRGAVQLRNVTITPSATTRQDEPSPILRPRMDSRRGFITEAGVRWPKLVRDVKPTYSPAAMQRGVKGVIELEALVFADGSVGAVGVKRSLGAGLDESAVAALWQWQFAPGTRDGVPVPVLVPVQMSFHLKK